jgi:hypothetical protein
MRQDMAAAEGHEPLISNGFLFRMTFAIGLLAVFAAGMSVVGKRMGDEIVLGGNTDSTEQFRITVGQDTLVLPANTIRFESQRRSAKMEAVSLYLTWPSMAGYTRSESQAFSNPDRANDLIFIDFSQSVMSRDMSGRIEPIYSKLFEGGPRRGPNGLTIHALTERSGFNDEKLLTGTKRNGLPYAVRCTIPAEIALATPADCQRDVHVGKDLTMLYRFSSTLLPQWERIDEAVASYASKRMSD